MEFKRTLLSLSIVTVLAGCGGGGGSNNLTPDPDPDPVEKNSKVCLDVNANALCDAGETSEQVVTWDEENPVETTLSGDVPLAYEGENGYIFTAPAGFDKIYAGTTMLNSELIFNQVIANKTKEDARAYVHNKLGGSPTADVTAEQKKDMAINFKKAIEAHPDASRYAVIAAVMNKAMTTPGNIKDITVSEDDVKKANTPSLAVLNLTESLTKNVDDKIEEQNTAGWLHADDASMQNLSARGGKIVAGSHYHNSLTVVNVADGELSHSPVSVLTDAGDGVDAASGASENFVRDVSLSADAGYVYVNIPQKNFKSTKFDDSTYGLYKAKIEADGSIKTTTTGTVIAIDESAGSIRLKEKVAAFVVASDDSKVVVLDSEDNLTVYDGNLANPSASIEVGDLKMETFFVTSTSVYAVTENADDDKKGDINKWSIDSLAGDSLITLDFVPQEIRINADETKLVAFNHGHDNSGQMSIAVVDLANSEVINSGSVKVTSDTGEVSPDFSTLAAVGHEDARLLIVNLGVPGLSVQSAHDIEEASRDVAFIDDSKVVYISSRNGMSVIDIEETTGNVNLDVKIDLALKGINRATVNGGGYFNAVIKDLTLSSAYENVGIAWSKTGLDGNLEIDAANEKGIVTRPVQGSVDVAGKIKADVSASFRSDAAVTGEKEFDVSVRKIPDTLPESQGVQTADNSAQYPAGNVDGSIFVAPVRFKNTEDNNVYGFNTVEIVASGAPELRSGTADIPKTYANNEDIVGVGIHGSNVIGVSKASTYGGASGQARIFTVAMDATGIMAETVLNSISITSGEPISRGTGFNADQSIVAVAIRKPDESLITEIYSVNAAGEITFVRTIAMKPDTEYGFHGPVAVNSDGTSIYQKISGNTGVIRSTAGGQHTTVELEETARVWYYNGRLFVNTYEGNVATYSDDLSEASKKLFSTGTGGRMYGGAGREINGKHYYFLPVQRAGDLNGVYQLEIQADGSLKEVALSKSPSDADGPDRFTMSDDGTTLFYSYRVRKGDNKGRWLGAVKLP